MSISIVANCNYVALGLVGNYASEYFELNKLNVLFERVAMQIEGITMIIRSLMGGGAERVMTTMANYWVARGVSVSIITSVPPDTDAYTLDSRVKRIWLKPPSVSFGSFFNFPWSTRKLKDTIREEGNKLIISFMDRSNIPVILATRGLNVKVVVAERIDPRTQNYGICKRTFMRFCYPRADAVTVLTENVKEEWAAHFVPSQKVHVVHNPVLPLEVRPEEVPEWLPEKFICCMGRLHYQKGFDILLDRLPEIFKHYPDYTLVILGEGEDRDKLEMQCRELKVEDKVIMPGFIKNPHSIMEKASLFVFPSRFEGFPNALVEAMALGISVVSFDCPSGPASLIEPGKNGLLLPPEDPVALEQAIMELLGNPEERKRLGEAAKKVQEKCHPEKVMQLWTSLLEDLQGDSALKTKGKGTVRQLDSTILSEIYQTDSTR
ncbi:glycosyltransferase family 4 protein [Maridesulfovibrio sp.]|uniref:glycosyltransferase family 4 protein n=1 Tax=Maridesulfovibrio sp. TaxID=2795000 RepID=UPI0029F57E19|nr:glycosyltransferase family 4 protein [Maridesulfovibrio sp.]